MEETQQILNISELIRRAQPLTGTSSFTSTSQSSYSESQPSDPHPNPSPSNSQTPNLNVLKPLNFPAVLTGTLTLPSHFNNKEKTNSSDSVIHCSCFQFTDGSVTICADILDFRPEIIGRKICVLAWNFLPLSFNSCSGGFLEIIRWEFAESFTIPVLFPLVLAAADCNDDSKSKYSIFGLLESVSPPFVVPCSAGAETSRNICGFLAKILVCDCKLCKRKDLNSGILDFTEENYKDHVFRNSLIVYFVGPASSWHPAFSRLIRRVISLLCLKKKIVYIGKKESQMMFVTTNKTSLHLPKLQRKWSSNEKEELRWLGEIGCYVGTVTGIFMQGIVIELDGNLMLLLTEHQLMVPHSLRVGTIILVRNVHFLQPKFSWTKLPILGACFITSISVESFSPLETKCHIKSNPVNVLRKFIGSLNFPAKLWVLLVVSCLRIKFAGIMSEKEILGSTNKGGLALEYITSHLPSSVYRDRHGVFLEYCKHGICMCSHKEDYSFLKLVVPISYFVNHCEYEWSKMLLKQESDHNTLGSSNQDSFILCRGRSYMKSKRRLLSCDDIGVTMLGNLQVCSSSGRLQLADATGIVDVVVANIPLSWNFSTIYEVEEFSVIMHGPPHKLDHSSLTLSEFLTCRSILGQASSSRKSKLSLYIYYNFQDQRPRHMYSSCMNMNSKRTFQDPEGGKYHLLWLRHKFPLLYEADQGTSNRSCAFVECIMLPWKLKLSKNDEMADLTGLSLEELQNTTPYPNRDNFDKNATLRKCDTVAALRKALDSQSSDGRTVTNDPQAECGHSAPSDMLSILCLISSRSSKFPPQGYLHCADRKALTNSGWRPDGPILLLEFDSNAMYLYQGLRIGSFYIMKYHEKLALCNAKVGRNKTAGSMNISSETEMWSLSFSSRDSLNFSDSSSVVPSSYSFVSTHEVRPEALQQFKLPLTSSYVSPDIRTDITLFVPVEFISYLKSSLMKRFVSVEEELDKCSIALTLSSGTSSNLLLPEGNLVSLHGFVLAVHDFDHHSVTGHWENGASGSTHQAIVFPETSRICIHVFVGYQMAKISGAKKKQVYPTGFNQGVHATFHRVLVIRFSHIILPYIHNCGLLCKKLMFGVSDHIGSYATVQVNLHSSPSGQNEYMLTPASFIVVNAYVANHQNTTACLDDSPAALISELTESMVAKPIQLRGRIVSLYILVLKSKRKADSSKIRVQTGTPIIDIPLAGFIIDDGSSSCCCWANYEGAATLLKLHFESRSPEANARTCERSRMTDTGKEYGSKLCRLNKILCEHGRVVVKNHGSMFDSSCLDLAFSVESGHMLSCSDEDFLRCFVLDACFSATWIIAGNLMDSTAICQLEMQLHALEMEMPPLRNVLASRVLHTNPLSEARGMIQELKSN